MRISQPLRKDKDLKLSYYCIFWKYQLENWSSFRENNDFKRKTSNCVVKQFVNKSVPLFWGMEKRNFEHFLEWIFSTFNWPYILHDNRHKPYTLFINRILFCICSRLLKLWHLFVLSLWEINNLLQFACNLFYSAFS